MLTSLVSLLPVSAQPYAKTITAALVSILTVLATTLEAAPSWLPILLAILSAPAVYAVPNLDPTAVAQDESTQPPEASFKDEGGTLASDIQAEVFDALKRPRPTE